MVILSKCTHQMPSLARNEELIVLGYWVPSFLSLHAKQPWFWSSIWIRTTTADLASSSTSCVANGLWQTFPDRNIYYSWLNFERSGCLWIYERPSSIMVSGLTAKCLSSGPKTRLTMVQNFSTFFFLTHGLVWKVPSSIASFYLFSDSRMSENSS